MRCVILILLATLLADDLLAAPRREESGWTLFQKRDYAAALKRFESEVNQAREWAPIHDAMGWCHYFLGDYDDAEAKFKQALEYQADYKWSLQGLEAVSLARKAPLDTAAGLLSAGRYQEARAAYRRIAQGMTAADPAASAAAARCGEGWCLYYLGRSDEAKKAFRAALKGRSGFADALRGIAWCEFASARYRETLTALQLSFKEEPDHYRARLTAGWCHYWLENYSKGMEEFGRAERVSPYGYEARAGRGWCLYRLGRMEEAFAAFVRAVQSSPSAFNTDLRGLVEVVPDWRLLYNYAGWSALRAHLDSQALQEFQTAVALDSANADAHRGLAFAYFRLDQFDKIKQAADLARPSEGDLPQVSFPVELADGSYAEIAMNLTSLQGWVDYRRGLLDTALAGFRRVRAEHEQWVDAACGEGWGLFSQGNYPAAEKVFAEAERLLPGYSDATAGSAAVASWRFAEYNSAWELIMAGDSPGALRILERLRDRPDHRFPSERADLLEASIGWARLAAGEFDAAEKAFRKALEMNGQLGLAHRGWGNLLMAQQDWRRAAVRLKLALNDPELASDAVVATSLGWCLLQAGDLAGAKETLERVVAQNPGSATALAGMGSYYLHLGLYVDARVEFERAVYIDPTVADRSDLVQKMATEKELWKLHSPLGWSWFYRGDHARAEKEFRLALEKDPLELSVARGLGILLLRSARLEEAQPVLESCLQGAPAREPDWGTWSETLSEYGWALYTAKQYREAMGIFKRLETLHEGQDVRFADPFDGQGWCYLRMNKRNEAKRAFLEAVGIEARHESSLTGLETLTEME